MFFVFQKFQIMWFEGYQKNNQHCWLLFSNAWISRKYFIANENRAKWAFCEKILALQKFLPQMNILLSLSRKSDGTNLKKDTTKLWFYFLQIMNNFVCDHGSKRFCFIRFLLCFFFAVAWPAYVHAVDLPSLNGVLTLFEISKNSKKKKQKKIEKKFVFHPINLDARVMQLPIKQNIR